MYRVLCYGDSNTWGYNPVNGLRFSEDERWTGVLHRNLGGGFEVLEDGKNGRSICGGFSSFQDSLNYNGPLDVVLIFLGINDICFEKEISVKVLISGMEAMVDFLRSPAAGPAAVRPEVIFISPVPVGRTRVADGLYELQAGKVERFGEALRTFASERGCGFIDSGRIIHPSEDDGIHIEAPEHNKLGLFVADFIQSFLKSSNLSARS